MVCGKEHIFNWVCPVLYKFAKYLRKEKKQLGNVLQTENLVIINYSVFVER